MTFNEFEQEVRDGLSVLGLPLTWQPRRDSLQAMYAAGCTVEGTVLAYRSEVCRYEWWANVGRLLGPDADPAAVKESFRTWADGNPVMTAQEYQACLMSFMRS